MNAMQDVLDEMDEMFELVACLIFHRVDPKPGTPEHYDWIRETYGNDEGK